MRRLLGWLEAFGIFWYDFVIGDDWTIAAGVAIALGATYGLSRTDLPAWWLLPVSAVALVVSSIVRARRQKPGR